MRASDFIKQGVTEGTNNITYKQQKGKNKFSVEMLVDGKPAGMFQYDANTGRTITELDSAHRGQGLGQRLILKGIYTAAMLGMDYACQLDTGCRLPFPTRSTVLRHAACYTEGNGNPVE